MNGEQLSQAQWRKSSYSNGQANCVEVAVGRRGEEVVAVRDSKARDGACLTFSVGAWQLFCKEIDTSRHRDYPLSLKTP